MKKIILHNHVLDELVKAELTQFSLDINQAPEIRKNLESMFWQSLTVALDSSESRGFSLSDIYMYTQVKKLVEDRKNDSKIDGTFIEVTEDTLKKLYQYFSEYQGWNPKAAKLIIQMDKILQEVLYDK